MTRNFYFLEDIFQILQIEEKVNNNTLYTLFPFFGLQQINSAFCNLI